MSIRMRLFAALMLACAFGASAQEQHSLSPDLAVSGTPTLVPKRTPSAFGEGVVADWEGNVYSNEMNVSPKRTLRLEVGADTARSWREVGDNGNGMWLDSQNRILICQTRAIVRVKPGPTFDNYTDTLCENPSGDDFNDITGDSKNNLYLTNFTGGSVFFWDAESGNLREALSNRPKPNGLEWDEERKRLYVNENGAGEVVAYTIHDDFSLTFEKKIADVPIPDGITLDERGNLYVVAFDQGVHVFDPEGQPLGKIPLSGSQVTNLGFGGAGFRTLFIITNRGLYRLPMLVIGYKSGNYTVSAQLVPPAPIAEKPKGNLLMPDGLLTIIPPGSAADRVDFKGRVVPPNRLLP